MNNNLQETKWSENVILVDADYVDKVAFDLIVNFERMIGRRIPKADFARWIDCVALDGGIRKGEHETLVVLIHRKGKENMENFTPGNYAEELNGKAFKDHLGEFSISAYPIEDIVTGREQSGRSNIVSVFSLIFDRELQRKVPDVLIKFFERLPELANGRMIDLYSEYYLILGYSLMAALGISSAELNEVS